MYSKHQSLLAGLLGSLKKSSGGKILDENGLPNILGIERLYAETDKDSNGYITEKELEDFIRNIHSEHSKVEVDYALPEILSAFDKDDDRKISASEFKQGCIKWIYEAKQRAESGDFGARNFFSQYDKQKIKEITKIDHVMARFLSNVQNTIFPGEPLINADGIPDKVRVSDLFQKFDSDEDNELKLDELEKHVQTVDCRELELSGADIAKMVMEDLNKGSKKIICKQDFVDGVTEWLKKAAREAKDHRDKPIDRFNEMMWKEVYELVARKKRKELIWASTKSVIQVIMGLAILTFLGEPLTTSILQVSDAMGVSSFFISFLIVPLALNARSVLAAISPASKKSKKIASLTFSEVYGHISMNNMVNLTALLLIVYAKDLKWDYTSEVLIILVITAAIGLIACARHSYPLWTCILAILLYPFSLALVYIVQFVLGWK